MSKSRRERKRETGRGEVRGKRREGRGEREEGRGKREEGRRKKEEGRGKREEERGKREDGRGKREEGRGRREEGRGRGRGEREKKEGREVGCTCRLTVPRVVLPLMWAAVALTSEATRGVGKAEGSGLPCAWKAAGKAGWG